MKKFYVYLYMREDMYSPYYVGSGCDRRMKKKTITHPIPIPPDERIRVVYEGEEEECRELEDILILFYGMEKYGGILLNEVISSHHLPLISSYLEEEYRRRKKERYERNKETINEKRRKKYQEMNGRKNGSQYGELRSKEEIRVERNRRRRERYKNDLEYREKQKQHSKNTYRNGV